uniref:Locustatachykinin-1 n=1 Tax=Locusta migratoria TaxID=7004 RepID=TKL1_LOCMI|nr:RecName: Full=Locustatachykinin-1; AltName: Full=Locustatachykinin I; Short=TK-I [Locusta migratoria]
GPSGFYGVR